MESRHQGIEVKMALLTITPIDLLGEAVSSISAMSDSVS